MLPNGKILKVGMALFDTVGFIILMLWALKQKLKM